MSSCAKRVRILPENDLIIDGNMFCEEPRDGFLCMSHAEYSRQTRILIDCQETILNKP